MSALRTTLVVGATVAAVAVTLSWLTAQPCGAGDRASVPIGHAVFAGCHGGRP